jgi:hypothetical protein
MGEEKYREVAQRFFDDGCRSGEVVGSYPRVSFFGWVNNRIYNSNGFFHHNRETAFGGRELTHEQIMEKETMTAPDWKTAPEGATHWSKALENFYRINDRSLFFFSSGEWKYSDDWSHLLLIERPTQPPAWHETGDLPPVGTECEFYMDDHCEPDRVENGDKVEIVCHYMATVPVAGFIVRKNGRTMIDGAIAKCFRPLRSDRDKAIEEIVKVLSYPYDDNHLQLAYNFAEQVYDAGYRKP